MNTTTQKNIALALCLSSMMVAAPQAEATERTTPINVLNTSLTVVDNVNITTTVDSQDGSNTEAAVSLVVKTMYDWGQSLDLKGDTFIRVTDPSKYALYSHGEALSLPDAVLSVNPDGDKKVQIVGNIKTSNGSEGEATINVIMNGSESYFAGDVEIERNNSLRSNINLTLKNGATWYPTQDTYSLGQIHRTKNDGIHIDASGGGVIDIYHSEPGTVRSTSGSRTFTINNINKDNASANGATFRIGSDMANNTADKIVLNGGSDVGSTSYAYSIQVVGDAGITTTQNITYDLASKQIVVAEVDGTKLTNSNTIIQGGGVYKNAAINGGLSLADITTTVKQGNDNKQWVLDTLRVDVRNNEGPAMLMAQLGAAGAQTAAAAWRADNNDLMRRMGDLRSGDGESGAWGKIYGGQIEARQGVGSKLDYRAVQVGFDRAHTLGDGRLFTGVTLSHLRGDMSSVAGNGDLNTTMFGIYGSYVGKRGHFADLIIKYGRMNNKINSYDASNSYGGEFGSNGINISAEYGYRHNFNNNVYIEPQVELTYSNLGGSDYTMRLNGGQGASVHSDAYKSLIGRIGFTLGKQYKQNNVYLKLGLAHEFQGDVGLLAMHNGVSAPYKVSGKSTWMEYGIGFNVAAGKNTNFYGEIEKTTGTVIRTNWRAHLGMRYSF